MANKQRYDVELSFKANSSGVKAELSNLSNLLNNLTSNVDIMGSSSKSIQAAKQDLVSLRTALVQAVNVDTGKMDLSKFSNSLRRSNTDLTSVRKSLMKMGPEGQAAFTSLAKSIVEAEIPMKRTNKLLSDFATTLKNTAKWQVSSTILQGFTGSIQEAYHYAQDLNKNLNEIRIVSGQNKDQMDKFAKSANKAAKELSTTTNEYTKASLIFYQQGLSDAQVKKRTDTVIKMSNVTGESANDVSSYMTAIWNNFDDGSESLEHYADVITALGAATASSSEEIAGGLEKFAAVADTIGLSYEYAASALATVVSATRQSEDTVGTSFKTIFSRLQSLSLGETLEDSTTLTKYSQALDIAGVKIKEQNGALKDMDTILDELGVKWQYLSKDQQVAIANTVAGTRQYANFISLMDNYGTFRENLGTARDSEGELQKQADIYAESWEAARDRVTASAETIYDNLLNDEFFIKLTDGFAGVLDMVNNIAVGAGGLNGILATTAAMILKVKSKEAASGLERMAYNLAPNFIKRARADELKNKAVDEMQKATSDGYISISQSREIDIMKNRVVLQREISAISENMTDEQRERLEQQLAINKALEEEAIKRAKINEEAEDEYYNLYSEYIQDGKKADTRANRREKLKEILNEDNLRFRAGEGMHLQVRTNDTADSLKSRVSEKIASVTEQGYLKGLNKNEIKAYIKNLNDIETELEKCGNDTEKLKQIQDRFNKEIDEASQKMGLYDNAIEALTKELMGSGLQIEEGKARKLAESYVKTIEAKNKDIEATKRSEEAEEDLREEYLKTTDTTQKWSEVIVSAAQGVLGLVGAISQLSSISNIMNDETLSGWDKFNSLLTTILTSSISLASSVSGFVPLFEKIAKAKDKDTISTGINTLVTQANTDAQNKNSDSRDDNADEIKENIPDKNADTVTEGVKNIVKKPGALKTGFKNFGTGFKAGIKGAGAAAAKGGAGASLGAAGSIGTAVGAALPWVAAAAAIVGVIALGVYVYNTAEREAKKAEAAAKAMSEAYEETNRQHKELLSSLEAYDNLQQKIDELAEGTEAWKDAIAEANEETRKLIESQNLIYGQDYEFGKGGRLVLKEGVLEREKEESERRANQALIMSQSATSFAKQKRLESDTVDLERSLTLEANVILDKIFADENLSENVLAEDSAFAAYIQEEIGYNHPQIIEELIKNREEISRLITTEKEIAAENKATSTQAILNNNPDLLELENGHIIAQNLANEIAVGSDKWNAQVKDLRGLSNKDLRDKVDDVFGGQYRLRDTNYGYVTLEQKNADDEWEIVGEKNDTSKEQIYAMLAAELLAQEDFGDRKNAQLALLDETYKDYEAILGLDSAKEEERKLLNSLAGQTINKEVDTIDLTNLNKEQIDLLQRGINNEMFSPEVAEKIQEAIDGYDKALTNKVKNNNAEFVAGTEQRKENERSAATSSLEANTQAYEAYRDSIAETNSKLADNKELLTAVADRNWILTAGIKDLNKVLKDNYNDVINYSKGSVEYSKAIGNISASLSAAFGDAKFNSDWIAENIEKIRSAASGDIYAIAEIGKAAAANSVDNLNVSNETKETLRNFFENIEDEVLTEAGADISVGNLNNLIKNEKISAKELNKIFQTLGIEASMKQTEDGLTEIESLTTLGTADIAANLPYIAKNTTRELGQTETLLKNYDKLEKELDDIEKKKDKAFGKNKLSIYDDEIEKLKQVQDNAEKLKSVYEDDLQDARANLAEYIKGQADLDITNYIDEDGNLDVSKILNDGKSNKGIDVETLETLVEDYEDIFADKIAQDDKINNAIEQQIEAGLEKRDYTIQLKVEMEDRAIQKLEYQLSTLEGKAYGRNERLDTIEKLMASEVRKYNSSQDDVAKFIEKINSGEKIDINSLTADDRKNMQETIAEFYPLLQTLNSYREQYLNELTEYINEFTQEFASQQDGLNLMIETIDTYNNIIGTVGKKTLGVTNAILRDMNEANKNLSLSTFKTTTDLLKKLEEKRERISGELIASTDKEREYWEEQLRLIEEEIKNTNSDMLSQWQSSIQLITEIFTKEVEIAAEEMEETLTYGLGSFEYMKSYYDQQKEISDRFLSNYEQIYEISKLTRQIDNSLAGTQSLKGKQSLIKLQEKIRGIQEDETELTRYDLEMLQKEYDLKVAAIALEEAQNAKSMVRLQRDSSGGLSYIYTADEQKVEAAKQKYEDSIYAMQKANEDYSDSLQEQFIDTQSTMSSELVSIMSDTTLDVNKRLEKISETYAYYMNKLQHIGQEMNDIFVNNQDLYDEDSKHFNEYLQDKILGAQSFGETVLGQLTGFSSIEELIEYTKTVSDSAISHAAGAAGQFQQDMSAVQAVVGAENMSAYITSSLTGMDTKSANIINDLNITLNNFNVEFEEMVSDMVFFQDQYRKDMEKLLGKYEIVIDGFSELLGYDTGGYTGDWGASGKLAILHEKEIVLNKSDTENLFKTVDVVRNISSQINNARAADFSYMRYGFGTNFGNSTVEQKVEIKAEFPNATNHSEIEEAFDNLINRAAQYANRK